MTDPLPYLIGDVPRFTPEVGRLVSMLNYVRRSTLDAVAGLTSRELDYLHDAQSNSIGGLYGRGLSEQEKRDWDGALALGEKSRAAIKGHDVGHYVRALEQVRAITLTELLRF